MAHWTELKNCGGPEVDCDRKRRSGVNENCAWVCKKRVGVLVYGGPYCTPEVITK